MAITIGQLVYWTDPDDDLCSNFARVVAIHGECITLEMVDNGHVEALAEELEVIDESPAKEVRP